MSEIPTHLVEAAAIAIWRVFTRRDERGIDAKRAQH